VPSLGAGQTPAPPNGYGRIWAVVPLSLERVLSPSGRFAEDGEYSRINAGVASVSSGRSLRPAVRDVTGFFGVSMVGSHTGSGDHVGGHNRSTPSAITKK